MTALIQPRTPVWQRAAVLDRFEQLLIITLWVLLVRRVDYSSNPFSPILLVSETAVAVFTLIRRPTQNLSLRLGDWLLAITATCAGLMVMPGAPPLQGLVPLGITLAIVGNCIQAWAKLTLRRSFGIAPANRGIKLNGPYRFVRHPMYAGYLVFHVSVMILMFAPMNILIYGIGWAAQILRLKAEENLLSQDPDYAAYMQKVRWRLVPGIF